MSFDYFLSSIFILISLFCVYSLFRNEIAYKHRAYWIDLIFKYNLYCIRNYVKSNIDYDDVVKYEKYFWKLFVFNKNYLIQDKEKFEILKSFEENHYFDKIYWS